MLAPVFLVLSFFCAVGSCKVYEDVANLPKLQYDFVVVGGGTAGNVVANRLTENPGKSRGLSFGGPFLLEELFGANIFNWNYTTTPQPGLNGRSIPCLRAHLLGGCSAHNGMVYTRGAADDFNRYAKLTGDEGWSWDRIFPYFLKSERLTPPADHHDTRGQLNLALHGKDGPISVSLNGFPFPTFEHNIIQTAKEHPDEFPFNLDMNSGQPLGVGWVQSTIGGGERSTSATGFLAPKFIRRPNLHVLLHAQVSKLVNATQKSGKPSFGSSLFVAHASKEIILSAGFVGTPQILMNSGIGARATLTALGIPTLLDLPSTLDSITQNATRFAEAMAQWNTSRMGPFVDSGVATHAASLRLATHSPAFAVHADPCSGPGAPHVEFVFMPGGGAAVAPGNFMTIRISLVSPASRGSVTISSSDPFAPPLIDLGYLTNDFDVLALRDAVGLAHRFGGARAWRGYLGALTVDLATLSPAALEAHLHANTGSSFHLVGTAGMSARGARYGVVDPDLRVKGVAGLSVVDASVLPFAPAAHTQAATYVLVERGADLVKQRWA
ncbi:aryl-alcohol-oxidase from pleurotus Eryingii [Mycena vulgaris]|nr:aryl-alcohol-oxidase from pleurotus Eryingii [Mycena vulgaris]